MAVVTRIASTNDGVGRGEQELAGLAEVRRDRLGGGDGRAGRVRWPTRGARDRVGLSELR